jgi:hypothetical protein
MVYIGGKNPSMGSVLEMGIAPVNKHVFNELRL